MNTIALSKINLKSPTQLRSSGEDMSHVEDLAYSYADTGSFKELPWVALIKDSNEYVPIDGFHRLTALQWLSEQESIECHLDLDNISVRLTEFDTMSEAIVAAAGVNASHGLKRKRTDIHNAILKLLEVDRVGFMKNKFTLDSEAIMKAVNCSSATYRRATEEIRKKLTDARDFEIKRLNHEGVSSREIAQRVSVTAPTVARVLSGEGVKNYSMSESLHVDTSEEAFQKKSQLAKSTKTECRDGLGDEKRHNTKTPQASLHNRKAKLIDSITRQLNFLSVEQLKSVDVHITTVSDF